LIPRGTKLKPRGDVRRTTESRRKKKKSPLQKERTGLGEELYLSPGRKESKGGGNRGKPGVLSKTFSSIAAMPSKRGDLLQRPGRGALS